ncbi:MAG: M3 family metallopeptidase [Patescibacteria group bacterium]
MKKQQTAKEYLNFLNKKYFKLHKSYEDLFWISYMGDNTVDARKDKALADRDAFRADRKHSEKIQEYLKTANTQLKDRLLVWVRFFDQYQTPIEAIPLKQKIDALESDIHKKRVGRKDGYVDPLTKQFILASRNKMGTMVRTNPDEKIRKACFDALQEIATTLVSEYIEVVNLRNEYARILGYEDFYAYKVEREDGMSKKELFTIFDAIYEKTKYANKNIIELEKTMLGLRKPWNFGYMMIGDFTKEEDPYFQFDDALLRWGKSFSALGIDFKGGKLTLDLLDRKGKYDNGFCHWPDLVKYENGKRYTGSSNFTCNVVMDQVGSGEQGYNTLFHEGGHAAHLLNSEEKEVCVNHEYAPMSTAWAETQSMFLDTVFSSVEWISRYARNKDGEVYPFELYEKILRKVYPLKPLGLNGIISVCAFERDIYETKDLNYEKVLEIAKKNFRKYSERSEDSLGLLNVPHIYSWESSASYHGYGLATLALSQWREYFFKKYGYIVDNPNIGKEMKKVWKFAGSKTFSDFVKLATGKKLSPNAYLAGATASLSIILKKSKERIVRLSKVKISNKKIELNATVRMVHGKKEIANNKKSFEDMTEKYAKWLTTQKNK